MVLYFRRWPWLLPLIVLLGLFAYMTATGLGGTSDSIYYQWAAHTWRESGQLLAPDGRPYRYWGPLYPLLLAWLYGPTGVRVLHGAALAIYLVLWALIGNRLLPTARRQWLPWLVALSAAVLVPAKYIWSETVFGALAAIYCYSLLAWTRQKQTGWLWVATMAGFLLPLQRTAGLFLLAGAWAGLLLAGLGREKWRVLLLHGAACVVGGLAWNYYAEVLAGPKLYQSTRPWDAWASVADYGFVLVRWLLPLGASWRDAVPALWVVALPGLLAALFPLRKSTSLAVASKTTESADTVVLRELRLLWWAVLVNIVALLLATGALRAATGPHNAERYCAALVGPVVLLVLARWPDKGTIPADKKKLVRWVGGVLLGGWLAYSAVRAGHNAQQLRARPAMAWPTEVQSHSKK
ncbi:hypothetical protein ACFST9_15435 [Hymenobacter monticola]|uniref:Glycosyltransferase RgtA/B/C/D-like domain-containing protein n=1 Tax=Hymenobacter monticola TaxID=1705399 RepID=A0ABY4B1I4_9BACT|nr:hypothetical protein [Hymenobacter monticola]UOE32694.1 hypothetical protein MTP16_16345 [Hymenobacter monticola]